MSRMILLYLLSLVLRSAVIGLLGGIVLMRSRRVEFQHAVWTAVLCCVLLMPIADAVLPATLVPAPVPEILLPIQVVFLAAPQTAEPAVPVLTPEIPAARIDGWQLAVVSVGLVSLTLLSRFAWLLLQVQRIKKKSRRVESAVWDRWISSRGNVTFAESEWAKVPLTVGFRRPFIILPPDWRSWDDWRLRAVLIHESTHVRRRDWAIGSAAAFAKCVFWFNPLVWWLERRLSSLAELASDEASVRVSGDPQRYAETLLQFAVAARHGHRWIGGVAMAQHKISLRIERVLALERPGFGILSRTAWVALFLAALPALYASAATQSAPAEMAPPLPTEMFQAIRSSVPVTEPIAASPQAQVPLPSTPSAPAAIPPAQGNPGETPAQPTSNAPAINPDLVGEIRLILSPVDVEFGRGNAQIQIQTRYTGTAVWNARNGALTSTWAANGNAFSFTLTGVQNRTLLFDGANGDSFSYGCPDCSFLVWETGVGAASASPSPGIVFKLSADGKSLSATCRAAVCRAAGKGQEVRWTGAEGQSSVRPAPMRASQIRESETWVFPVLRDASSVARCFSVSGNVKADGTPFTDADCTSTVPLGPVTAVIFFVTR
jgi:beta-lactamase regulating signal transducer with metallopeptidase domain